MGMVWQEEVGEERHQLVNGIFRLVLALTRANRIGAAESNHLGPRASDSC